MSTDVMIPNQGLAVNKYADDKSFNSLASAKGFLPRLQLYVAISSAVANEKIRAGYFGTVTGKDSITELGKVVHCYPLAWRFKAVRFGTDAVITKYNPKDAEFLKIQAEADVPQQRGAMVGIEFLLYIPETKQYVTYYMSNVSSRAEAPNLRALIGSTATISSKLMSNKKGNWHGPVITACSTPLDGFDMDEAKEHAEKFANPKETEIESVSAGEAAANERPQ